MLAYTEFCRDCVCLVADNEGNWICDELQIPCEIVDICPEDNNEQSQTILKVREIEKAPNVLRAFCKQEAIFRVFTQEEKPYTEENLEKAMELADELYNNSEEWINSDKICEIMERIFK